MGINITEWLRIVYSPGAEAGKPGNNAWFPGPPATIVIG